MKMNEDDKDPKVASQSFEVFSKVLQVVDARFKEDMIHFLASIGTIYLVVSSFKSEAAKLLLGGPDKARAVRDL